MIIEQHKQNKDEQNNSNKTSTKNKENKFYACSNDKQTKISNENAWTWQRKGIIIREIESLSITAQNNALGTNCVQVKIDVTKENSKYMLWGDWDKSINHIIS